MPSSITLRFGMLLHEMYAGVRQALVSYGLSTLLLAVTAVALYFGHWFFKLFRARSFYWGLPQPPNHTFRYGHLMLFHEVAAKFPPNTHPQHMYTYMAQKYNLPGIFYVDCWPFADHQMVITDPDAAMQVLTKNPYPKHRQIEKFLRPFTGKDSIAASNGERWKMNHRMVGSGFTPTYIKPMMGMIVDHVLVFHDTLRKFAESGESFSMEEESAKVVFDVIGKIVFGFSLEAQRNGSPLLHDLRSTIDPATATLDDSSWKPWANRDAKKKLAALKQRVHDTLAKEMNGRLPLLKEDKDMTNPRRAKSIMDRIVLDKLQTEPHTTKLDDTFIETVVTNLKALLLGGHGTTTDTFTFATMFLSLHPDVVERLRQEHNEHFAADLDTTVEQLVAKPTKTNDLEYTNAVIKETLRFFPIGFTIRQAPPGVKYLDWNGKRWPVKNCMVIPCAHTSHMDPKLWNDPKAFRPDRFLGDEGEEMHRFAWRAFERGPRACIAQDLAMDELRVLLLLTVRWFDFETIVEGTSERVMYMDLDKQVGDLAFQEVGMEAPRGDGEKDDAEEDLGRAKRVGDVGRRPREDVAREEHGQEPKRDVQQVTTNASLSRRRGRWTSIFSRQQRVSLSSAEASARDRRRSRPPMGAVLIIIIVVVVVVVIVAVLAVLAVRVLKRRQDTPADGPANRAQVRDWHDNGGDGEQQGRVHARAAVEPRIVVLGPSEQQTQREGAEDVGHGGAHDVADGEGRPALSQRPGDDG
ncbi:cytochrome p450 [Purpureocillium lavendulum]|uniref:Cytochrome p450 n=1 Tax=Purpureocillium lavendulum TaxID=1247861 RepID=A0AB34FXU0_9HYPO|nr:cytochrome p450 [Purpureocillium lavendulum]